MPDGNFDDTEEDDSQSVETDNGLTIHLSGQLADHLDHPITNIVDQTFEMVDARSIHCELSLALTDNEAIRELNKQFRGKDKATNVLSFPSDEPQFQNISDSVGPPHFYGDVIIALETVKFEAISSKKTISNHMSHLIIHGVLHLLGYDHQTDEEANEMENLERKILAGFSIPDPYKPPELEKE